MNERRKERNNEGKSRQKHITKSLMKERKRANERTT